MYNNGSSEFNNLINTDGGNAVKVKLVFDDFEITSDYISKLVLNGGSNNSDDIAIGTTNSAYLDVELVTDRVIANQEFQLMAGMELSNGTTEYIPMGYYTVQKPTENEEFTQFTACDRMQKLEKVYISSLTYPTTSISVINEICSKCGITLATTGLSSISIAEKLEGYTCREVLGYIAGLYGCFACFDRNGQLLIRWYDNSTITKELRLIWSLTKAQRDYTVEKVTIAKDNENIYTSGSGLTGINSSNPYATQQIADNIYSKLNGFAYRPCELSMLDDIRLDCWDIVEIEYIDGSVLKVPAMSLIQNFTSGSTQIVSFGKTETENEYNYSGPVTQSMDRLTTEMLVTNRVVATKVDADWVKANTVSASRVEAVEVDVDTLKANKADIDFANVKGQVVGTSLIQDGAVTNEKVGNLSANKITSGSIDASKITVTNLNAKNIKVETINGVRVDTDIESAFTSQDQKIDEKVDELQQQIDGAIETFTKTEIPTLNNEPASAWTTDEEKVKHIGDLCYVINPQLQADGYCYRFADLGSGETHNFSWVLIKDSDVTKALQDIITINGEITGIKQFDTQVSSWQTQTDEELSSVKSRTTTLETDIGTKVESSVFNELKQTVDENSSSITSLSTTVSKKADSSTVEQLTNTVNSVKQTADTNTSSISSMQTTISNKADSSTVTALSNTVNTVKQTADANTSSISSLQTNLTNNYSTTTQMNSAISQKANEITSSVSATYQTKTQAGKDLESAKTYADNVGDTTLDSAKSDTAEKLKSYSTTAQMNSAINQSATAITQSVSATIDKSVNYEESSGTELALDTAEGGIEFVKVRGNSVVSKNLFDFDKMMELVPNKTRIENGWEFAMVIDLYRTGLAVNIKAPFTISFKAKCGANTKGFRVWGVKADGSLLGPVWVGTPTDWESFSQTFTTDIIKVKLDWTEMGWMSLKDFMIESGTQVTDYEPYFGGIKSVSSPIVVEENRKNLFDGITDKNWGINSSEIFAAATPQCKVIKVKSGESYTLSGDFSQMNSEVIRVAFTTDAPTIGMATVDYQNGRSPKTVTVPSGCNYMIIRLENTTISDWRPYQIQVEKGQATDYVPYQHKEITIPTSDELRGINNVRDTIEYITDISGYTLQTPDESLYLNRFCEVHRLGVVDLGSLNWGINVDYAEDKTGYVATLPNCVSVTNSDKETRCLCSNILSYPANTLLTYYTSLEGVTIISVSRVFVSSKIKSNISAFKSAMQGVQLVYELAQPLIIPIPDQQAFNEFVAYKDKTFITADGLAELTMKYSGTEVGSNAIANANSSVFTEAKLELKVDKDNLISEINASADKINLESDELIIKSRDFSLVKGVAEMVGGKIGGWSIQDKKLVSNINGWGGITEADLNRVSAYISGAGTLTSRQIDYYDLNLDGKVDVNDYALIRNCFIKGNYPSSEYLAQDKVKKCTISIIIDPINYEGIVTINTAREYYGFGDYTQVIGLQKTELKTIVGESLFSGHDIRANSDIISDYEGNRYSLNSIGQTINQMSKVIDIPNQTVPCGSGSVIGINSIDLQVGTYQIIGSAVFPANATGDRGICFSTTGGLALSSWGTNGATKVRATAGGTTILAVNMFIETTTLTKLYLNEYQNSGSNLSVIGRIRAIKLA